MFTRSLITLLLVVILAPQCLAELDQDTDGDGIIDRFDNCYIYPNPLQGDADSDGWGNRCDADLDNNGIINFEDLNLFTKVMFTSDRVADFNEDGIVNFLDLRLFRSGFLVGRPGPAIVMRWSGGSGFWNDASNWQPPQVPGFTFATAIIDTPDDIVVTIEKGASGGAKHLELTGNLVVCGSYSSFKSITVIGTLSTGCGSGGIDARPAIDLAGKIILESGNLTTIDIRNMGSAESSIDVTGTARLSDFAASGIATDVDISIKPGATLNVEGQLTLNDTSITLQSANDMPAELFTTSSIVGTGNIRFEGVTNPFAPGVLRTFSSIDIGPDIEISIDPNAYAFLDGRFNNFGRITVSDSATLFFSRFNLNTNEGQIVCSNDGRLREIQTEFPSPGDSILTNTAAGSLIADNCIMDWPKRIINSGLYEISRSQIQLPAIAASVVPLQITETEISLEAFQPPVPDNFYLFDPANENNMILKGLLNLGDQTLEIDGSKWRFADGLQIFGPSIEFGTLVSETPLNIDAGVNVRLFALDLRTELTLDPAANLTIGYEVDLQKDIHFLEPEDCNSAPGDATVLKFIDHPLPSSNSNIRAESSAAPGETTCLRTEIVNDHSVSLPEGVNLIVSNAEMNIHAEGNRTITIEGDIVVSGADSILTLQQTTIANFLDCSAGATVLASGSVQNPFVNSTLITSNDCDIHFSGSWLNNGDVFASFGRLNFTGPEDTVFTPGSGSFITDRTDIVFDLDISDPSSLDIFKVIPPGASFTFAGAITNPGPVIDLNEFPFNARFGDGFELADTRVTGLRIFWLSGSTTLRNVELAVPTYVSSNSTLNVFEKITMDEESLVILSNSNDEPSSTTRVLMHGVPNISGTGAVILQSFGQNAVSKLIQTVDDTPISIDAGLDTICISGGQCRIEAGAGSGKIELFGDLFVADETSRLNLDSDTSIYRTAHLLRRGQIRVTDATGLIFSGPESGLEISLFNEPMEPGITAEGSATIDISDAALVFVPGENYALESDETVTVLSHQDTAQRVGEFADVSGAAINGLPFNPDYSSPDFTIFRGPVLDAPTATQ